MELRRVGEHGLLVLCADAEAVRAVYAGLRAEDLHLELDATEIVPAATTVLLDGLLDVDAVEALLADWEPPAVEEIGPGPLVEIPTRYDGPDLDEVAAQWDVTTAEVVEAHRGTEFVVAFCGFAPGFAYCTGWTDERVVRRRAEPRPAVPPGSVALAGEFTSVYPAASPGGWQLVGSTDVPLWTPGAERPALLAPGTRVVFVDA